MAASGCSREKTGTERPDRHSRDAGRNRAGSAAGGLVEAARNGARIATMPGITEEMFRQGAITADYGQVKRLTDRMTAMLTEASTAVIEKDGCRLTIDLTGRSGVPGSGVYRLPGEAGNLPSGEAYIAPLENGSNGEMIIDSSMVGIGKLSALLRVTVKDGRLQSIEGPERERLSILLENDANATLGELGIGTNRAAILSGVILEDEKVYGTVHIAFGTNASFGWVNRAACHMDGIILKPTLYLDGKKVIGNGEFVMEWEGWAWTERSGLA